MPKVKVTFDALELSARRQRFETDGKRAIEGALTKLILGKNPKDTFFCMLAMRLRMKPLWDDRLPTAGVDGTTMVYNPEFIAGLTPHECLGLIVHEVMHCALQHHTRRQARDASRWNIAADLAINWTLIEAGYTLPSGGLMPGKGDYHKMPIDKSTEWYYHELPRGEDADGAGTDPGGCGAVMDAGDPAQAAQSEADWQIAVAQAESLAKQRGELPAGLQRAADAVVRPQAPWSDLLRRFVSAYARNDYAWFPPNRRYLHMGLYMPSVRSEQLGTVVIAFDTSGSISQEIMNQFAAEIEGILSAFDCKVLILYHDIEVAGEQEWCSTDGPINVEPVGGGGTSHVAVFDRVEEMDEPPACVVCLTDGYTEYPDNPPMVPVLWVMTTDQVAPFGETVPIDPD